MRDGGVISIACTYHRIRLYKTSTSGMLGKYVFYLGLEGLMPIMTS